MTLDQLQAVTDTVVAVAAVLALGALYFARKVLLQNFDIAGGDYAVNWRDQVIRLHAAGLTAGEIRALLATEGGVRLNDHAEPDGTTILTVERWRVGDDEVRTEGNGRIEEILGVIDRAKADGRWDPRRDQPASERPFLTGAPAEDPRQWRGVARRAQPPAEITRNAEQWARLGQCLMRRTGHA